MKRGRLIFRTAWAAAALLVVSVLLCLCFRGVDFAGLSAAWEELRLPLVFVAVLLLGLILFVGALEWKLFLPAGNTVSTGRLLKIIAVMGMLQNTLHHFAGQAFAVVRLGHREKLSKATALSILAQDQIAEGFARLLWFGFLAIVMAIPAWASNGIEWVALIVIVGYAAALALAWRYRNFDDRQPARSAGWGSLGHFIAQWGYHLRGLRDTRIALLAVLLAVSKKCSKAAAVACVQRSLSIDLPFYAPFLIVGALDLATMISIAPGHIGVFEATVKFSYQYLGVDADRALLLALVYHAAYLVAMVLPGLLVGFSSALARGPSGHAPADPSLANVVQPREIETSRSGDLAR